MIDEEALTTDYLEYEVLDQDGDIAYTADAESCRVWIDGENCPWEHSLRIKRQQDERKNTLAAKPE